MSRCSYTASLTRYYYGLSLAFTSPALYCHVLLPQIDTRERDESTPTRTPGLVKTHGHLTSFISARLTRESRKKQL